MLIKEKEYELFTKWKSERKYDYFISDGVVNEEEWNKQNYKILFVLKEANWQNENADLCTFLLSESSPTYWKTWNNIARWTKAILVGGDYPYHVSNSDKTYWLSKVAVMNLKKVGGDAVAENDTIWHYAENDRKFLRTQIELYHPDIIICCGRGKGKLADIMHDIILRPEKTSQWQAPVCGQDYFWVKINKKNIPVISFYHPQIRGGHSVFKIRYEEIKQISAEMRVKHNNENV